MELTFFDTETTGLDILNDNPIQFASLEFDPVACRPIRATAFYIKPRNGRWDEGAAAVHKISPQFLLEHGQPTALALQSIYAILQMQDVAGYNSKLFDLNMLNHAAEDVGGFTITPYTHLDVMTYAPTVLGGKKRKLTKLTEELGFSVQYIEKLTEMLFKCDSAAAHDARYDVVSTAFCYAKLYKMEQEAKRRVAEQEAATNSQFTGVSLEV